MKHSFFLAIVQGALLTTSAASAQPLGTGADLYIGGSLGIAYFHEIEGAEYDLGFAISAFGGFDIRPSWRTELEISYEEAEFENSADETSLFRLSGSLHKDFEGAWDNGWTPYAGGGLGIVNVDVGNDEGNIELSGHIEGGVAVPMGGTLYVVPSIRTEYILLEGIDDQVITQFRAAFRTGL